MRNLWLPAKRRGLEVGNRGLCMRMGPLPLPFLCEQVGQVHGGLMGVIQRAMVKACPHVWFERSEVKDRHLVARR